MSIAAKYVSIVNAVEKVQQDSAKGEPIETARLLLRAAILNARMVAGDAAVSTSLLAHAREIDG